MKALSEQPQDPFNFSRVKIERIVVGDQEIGGNCVLSVRAPSKGAPFWEVRYDIGNGTQVLYAASTPIQIEAVEIEQEQVETKELDDDE